MNYNKFIAFFRKWIEPFGVIGVIIILVFISVQLSQGNELRTEISQNCGWGDEDYMCFCEKYEALGIKNIMDNEFEFSGFIEGGG